MGNPKKWHEVYAHGTKRGDEEAKVFRALSRGNAKWTYRSLAAIEKSSGLDKERIEEIIEKYATQYDPPLIYPHPNQDDLWGYWERCLGDIDDVKSISGTDKQRRIDNHLSGADLVVYDSPIGSSN